MHELKGRDPHTAGIERAVNDGWFELGTALLGLGVGEGVIEHNIQPRQGLRV